MVEYWEERALVNINIYVGKGFTYSIIVVIFPREEKTELHEN